MQVHINLATTRHELKPSGRLDALQQPLRDPMAHGLPLDFNSVPKVADQVVMQVTRRDEPLSNSCHAGPLNCQPVLEN